MKTAIEHIAYKNEPVYEAGGVEIINTGDLVTYDEKIGG